MDRSKLQILLNDKVLNKTPHIEDEEKDKTMRKFHKKHENYEDVIIAIEEMAELTQVLSKIKRGKTDATNISIIEEIADVRLCMYQIAHYVFDMSADSMNIVRSVCIEKDENDKRDATIIAMKRMSRLSNRLSKIIDKKDYSKSKLMHSIAKVEASMLWLIDYYELDYEKVRYVEDIKMERTKERLKNGTD